MSSQASLLRSARAEVVPHLHELAIALTTDPTCVRHELEQSFSANGADPREVSELNWLKTERHTISAFLIDTMTDLMVEGDGRNAHFKGFQPSRRGLRGTLSFINRISAIQLGGVQALHDLNTFTDTNWLPNVAQRYTHICRAAQAPALQATIKRPDPVIFGDRLDLALRSPSLLTGAFVPLKIAKDYIDDPGQQLEAAHNLIHFPLNLAALHALEFALHRRTIILPPLNVHHTSQGDTRATFQNKADMRTFYPHLADLPTVRLKCPAQVNNNLARLLHATINASATFKV